MKSSENKFIADKLESLDSLPEGYRPDMNSKWALLEEAMNERESAGSRTNKMWLNIAACLLALVTCSIIWIYTQRTITVTLIQQPPTEKAIAIESISPGTSVVNKHVVPNKSLKSHSTALRQNEMPVPATGEMTSIIGPQTLADSVIHEEEKITPPVLTEKNIKKPKKQRFVQVDFDDPINTVYMPISKSNFAQLFRIKLGIGNPAEKPGTNSENTFAIKLH